MTVLSIVDVCVHSMERDLHDGSKYSRCIKNTCTSILHGSLDWLAAI